MPAPGFRRYRISGLALEQLPGGSDGWQFGAWSGWAHHPDLDPFGVRFVVRRIDGQLCLTDLALTHTDPSASITAIRSTTLRAISTSALIESIREEVARRSDDPVWKAEDSETVQDLIRMAQGSVKKKRRSRVEPDRLRDIAELRLSLNGQRAANRQIAELLQLSLPVVADYLHRATVAGYLLRAHKGAQRREPGPALLEARRAAASKQNQGREETNDEQ